MNKSNEWSERLAEGRWFVEYVERETVGTLAEHDAEASAYHGLLDIMIKNRPW